MSQYHIDRIASVIDGTFASLIDMSDWAKRSPEETRSAFLSRGIAALAIKALAGADDTVAAMSVVDGYGDGGIDAILFDQTNDILYFVQSKWNADGTTPMNEAACATFVNGVKDILAGRIDRFNDKVKAKRAEILAALRADRLIKIFLITAHTATQAVSGYAFRRITDFVNELNTPSIPDQATAVNLKQDDIYGLITGLATPKKIDMPISLRNWGSVETPFLSYYGQANIMEVASW